MSTPVFYAVATLTVAAASAVVLLRNPVHSAMSLVLALFLISVNYVALHAHLVAALQIIVYTGAVMVLFLFVIMLLNLQAEEAAESHVGVRVLGVVAAVAVACLLARTLTTSPTLAGATTAAQATETEAAATAAGVASTPGESAGTAAAAADTPGAGTAADETNSAGARPAMSYGSAAGAEFGTTRGLARVLFREHVVAFELTSLLLLVAVVGAVVLARRERV